jgi:tetratricopeptide (TPR) repeat protein
MQAKVLSLLMAVGLVASWGAGCAGRSTSPAHDHDHSAHGHSHGPVEPHPFDEKRVEALSRYATGISQDLRGDSAAALEEYIKAAESDPKNLPLVLDVSRRLARARRFDDAGRVLSRAAREAKPDSGVQSLLGAIYAQSGKTNEAIAACKKAMALAPAEFAGYQNLFQVYLTAQRYKEALAVLDQAAKQKEVDEDFLLDLAEQFLRYGRLRPTERDAVKPKALAAFDRVNALQPEGDLSRMRLGDGYRSVGEDKKAEAVYLSLLERAPRTPTVRQKLLEIYIRTGDEKGIETQLRAISGQNPSSPQAWFLLGGLYADQRKWPEAIENFRKAMILDPNLEPVYYALADAYVRDEKPQEAIATISKARQLFGSSFQVEFAASLAYSSAKDYPSALRALTAAELIAKTTETNRLNESLFFQLGAMHERNKDYETADKYFRKCLERNPDFAEALNYLGYMWAEQGKKLDEAYELIDKAVKLEPENAAFLDSMAWVLYQQGKAKEALPWMEKALKLVTEPDATLYDHLGDIYLKLGDKAKARDAWRKSLEIEKLPEVQKKLDALDSKT